MYSVRGAQRRMSDPLELDSVNSGEPTCSARTIAQLLSSLSSLDLCLFYHLVEVVIDNSFCKRGHLPQNCTGHTQTTNSQHKGGLLPWRGSGEG